tara:strand:+ start:135 stop:530 length:396 start_codon:yes stop_codon:yes gene_type:complete
MIWIMLGFSVLGLLQGCAGSPVGEKLENSFNEPLVAEKKKNIIEPNFESIIEDSVVKTNDSGKSSLFQQQSSSLEVPHEPYRVTIRLLAVDPSAPAEKVTRALRDANVRFAIERIEQVSIYPQKMELNTEK